MPAIHPVGAALAIAPALVERTKKLRQPKK
jgi:hypothetical protein